MLKLGRQHGPQLSQRHQRILEGELRHAWDEAPALRALGLLPVVGPRKAPPLLHRCPALETLRFPFAPFHDRCLDPSPMFDITRTACQTFTELGVPHQPNWVSEFARKRQTGREELKQ